MGFEVVVCVKLVGSGKEEYFEECSIMMKVDIF